MGELTLEALGVPSTTIHAVEAVVRSRRGVIVVAGKSADVVKGLEALCNLEPLREIGVAVISYSGLVGPARATRFGLSDTDYSWAQCFRDAMASAFGAVVLGEIAGRDVADALFEDWEEGPFNAVGVHTWHTTAALTRLLDMGLPVQRVRKRLAGVLSVRLAPRLCQECREERAPTPPERAMLEPKGRAPSSVSRAPGCVACQNSGVRGEVALSEWMEVTPSLRDLFDEREATLRAAAFPGGAGAFPSDGLRLLDEGLLSVAEWTSVQDSRD